MIMVTIIATSISGAPFTPIVIIVVMLMIIRLNIHGRNNKFKRKPF